MVAQSRPLPLLPIGPPCPIHSFLRSCDPEPPIERAATQEFSDGRVLVTDHCKLYVENQILVPECRLKQAGRVLEIPDPAIANIARPRAMGQRVL